MQNKQIPVLPFLLPPPPLMLEQAKPKKRRPNSGRNWDTEEDWDWLMDFITPVSSSITVIENTTSDVSKVFVQPINL